jgi:hypothetical protein
MDIQTLLQLTSFNPCIRIKGIKDILDRHGFDSIFDILLRSLADVNDDVVLVFIFCSLQETLKLIRKNLNGAIETRNVELLWDSVGPLIRNKYLRRIIRIECFGVLAALAFHASEIRLKSSDKRLHDIMFISACDICICDVDEIIRMESFNLITGLQRIDALLIAQAISKSRLDELVDSVSDSFCGLFVHGMEDEFECVRLACMRAIFAHTLATHQSVIEKAVDPVIDAFNDDSSAVRLSALKTLTSICIIHRVRLDLEQIELSLHLLVDPDPDIREAVRNLLAIVIFTDVECVRLAFKGFARSLAKFQDELAALVMCSGKIGRNHSRLICELIPSLLRLEKFYLPTEPRVEDQNYLVVLSAILNALFADPNLAEYLPTFISKQYHYVHASFPSAIPSFSGHKLHLDFFVTPPD